MFIVIKKSLHIIRKKQQAIFQQKVQNATGIHLLLAHLKKEIIVAAIQQGIQKPFKSLKASADYTQHKNHCH